MELATDKPEASADVANLLLVQKDYWPVPRHFETTKPTKMDIPWEWDPAQDEVFNELNKKLTTIRMLQPVADQQTDPQRFAALFQGSVP